MSIETTSCITPRCDRCRVPAMNAAGTLPPPPAATEALADLSGPTWGWLAGSGTQICPACLAALAAAANERGVARALSFHNWGRWQELPQACEPDGEDLLIRVCVRCGRDEVTSPSCLTPTGTNR